MTWRDSFRLLRASVPVVGAISSLALGVVIAPRAQAQDNYTYTGTGGTTTAPTTSTTFTGAFTDTTTPTPNTTPAATDGTLTFGGGASYAATDDIASLTLAGLAFTNTAGTVTINASNAATIYGTGTTLGFAVSTGSVVFAPAISENAATLTFSGATGSGNTTINGVISGSGGLTDNLTGNGGTGAGGILLQGANTYSGVTNIGAGATLVYNNVNALGATGAGNGTIIANGGELDINSLAVGTSAENITLNGTGIGSSGAMRVVGSLNLSGAINLGSNSLIVNTNTSYISNVSGTIDLAGHILTENQAASPNISGIISSSTGVGGLTNSGTGTLTLSGANTYTGATTVNAGTLQAGIASVGGTNGAFGNNSAVTLANVANTTLALNGFNTQIGSLTGGGTTGGNVTLGAATLTVGGDNTSPAAYAGVISGTGAVTKIGIGTETLSGYSTYTGGTTVSAGTLALNAGGGSGTVMGSVTVSSGAILSLTATDALGYSSGSTVTAVNVNGGTVNISSTGNEGYLTSFNLTGGTLRSTGGGAYNLYPGGTSSPGITSNSSGTTSMISGMIDIRGGALVVNVATGTVPNNGADLLVSGVINDNASAGGGALTKTGSGYLNLTGQNTFTGAVTVSGGTLNVGVGAANNGSTGALGLSNTVKAITVSSGATLSGTANNWFGNNSNADANLPSITVNGGVLSTTRYTTLGALALNGATVTSSVTQDSGNYQAFALRGNVTVGGTAASTINSTNVTATTGGYHLGANTIFTVASTGSATPDLVVSAPLINQSGDFSNAAGGLTKAGAGTMALNATNTYTGPTAVNVGTLLVNGSTAATSAVTVGTTGMTSTIGTLGGTGTVSGATTVNAGGTITGAGMGTVGALTLQSTVILTGGTYAVDISGATSDKLTITGALTLTNANITFNGTPTAPSYVLATFASESGTFTGNPPSGYIYQLNGTGTELDLVAVPEPATWLGGCLLLGLTGMSQRRRINGWFKHAAGAFRSGLPCSSGNAATPWFQLR